MTDHAPQIGLNRRHFEEEVEQQLKRSRRYEERAALMLVDVGDFKRFSDTGHAFGDEVLRHVGAVMRACRRGTDALSRIGGDEFAVLMPRTGGAKARATAESLLESLRSTPATIDGKSAPATASPEPRPG